MKNYLKTFALLSFVLLVTISACKKDEEDTATPKTATEYLTAGFWKTTSITINPGVNFGGTVITDFYAQMLPCSKDDITRFNANGTITDDEGATKCDVNDPQTTTDGTWVLSADNSSITITYPGDVPMTMVVGTLNATTFVGTYTLIEDFGSGPLTYAFTVTMVLQ